MKSMLTRKDVVIRSIDTEGPTVDLRPGKMFETYAISEAIQNRLLKDMPAAEAVDIMAKKYRAVL
jgi:multiple sugar transport system substrate-binding protein